MNKLEKEIETGTYLLAFVRCDIKTIESNETYQIRKNYEFQIIGGEFDGRKVYHDVYTLDQADEFEYTFKNGNCMAKIHNYRCKVGYGKIVIISCERTDDIW